uniref:ARAD1C32142p n=1 Tax=Blastobotrys adeninivorans TaxID=409370 RepID=A0A060T2W8_BLAAD
MKRRVESPEWTQQFVQLNLIFRSVCTLCTLFSNRTRSAKVITKAVDNELKTEWSPGRLDYLAQIKALLPEDVLYDYALDPEDPDGTADELLSFELLDYTKSSKLARTVAARKKLIHRRCDKFEKVINAFLSDGGDYELLQDLADEICKDVFRERTPDPPSGPSSDILLPANEHLGAVIEQFRERAVKDGVFELAPRVATYAEMEQILSQRLQVALSQSKGITKLYSHQAQALTALMQDNKSVIVSTSTSSGKSLIYQAPVLETLINNPASTAFCIFPTKALAQDQKRSFNELLYACFEDQQPIAETYDGDTPAEDRERIRNSSSIIFTNPDMLHANILPSHASWRQFLVNLKFVLVDELHVYGGGFGAHVAYVIRRLVRLCEFLGNNSLRFISCSATIRDPVSQMRTMFNLDDDQVKLVDEDGSPLGKKNVLVIRPPPLNPIDPNGGMQHPVSVTADMLIELMSKGVRTIAFCKVRRSCELLIRAVKERLKADDERYHLANKVTSYRGGYMAEDRRKIESGLFNGNLLAIVATNALELGIDIGSLDAVLVMGFPFSISSLRQQFGRAGRSHQESLAVFIGGGDPIDQHFTAHPKLLFDAPDVEVPIDIDNVLIAQAHVQCAAFELPIIPSRDEKYFDLQGQILNKLTPIDDGDAYTCDDRLMPWPPKNVNIRGANEDEFAVVDTTNDRNLVIETIEASRTSFTLYEGGIFLHKGLPYLVRYFDPDNKLAKVTRVHVDWITRQRDFTDVDPGRRIASRRFEHFVAEHGTFKVTTTVFGFFKLDRRNRIIGSDLVDNPPYVRHTKGFWIDLPKDLYDTIKSKKLSAAAAIHATEHAIMNMMGILVQNAQYIGTECKAPEKEFAKTLTSRLRPARLVFYDRGGANWGGGAKAAFEYCRDIIATARERVETCPCATGCPECVASEYCSEKSLVISKWGALVILNYFCGQDSSSVPDGPEPNLDGLIVHETVVPVF